jgi:hypothetical protein
MSTLFLSDCGSALEVPTSAARKRRYPIQFTQLGSCYENPAILPSLAVATFASIGGLILAASLSMGSALAQAPPVISEGITSSAQGDDESNSIRLFRQPDITAKDVNAKSRWLHPGPDSSLFTDTPFTDYRRIEVRVSATELRAALVAMRKAMPRLADASEDPRDYQLVHFNINPEVFAPARSRGRLGVSIRAVQVELFAP